jgi:hypothetical protein
MPLFTHRGVEDACFLDDPQDQPDRIFESHAQFFGKVAREYQIADWKYEMLTAEGVTKIQTIKDPSQLARGWEADANKLLQHMRYLACVEAETLDSSYQPTGEDVVTAFTQNLRRLSK